MTKKTKGGNNSIENNKIPSIEELLQTIIANQQEFSDRLSDLEEKEIGKVDGSTTAVKLANMYFKPEDKYLPDVSWISPLAARPFAVALTLDKMTDAPVRRGDISLTEIFIYYSLHFSRGIAGRLMHMGKEALEQQVSAEAVKSEEEMPEFEAGRE